MAKRSCCCDCNKAGKGILARGSRDYKGLCLKLARLISSTCAGCYNVSAVKPRLKRLTITVVSFVCCVKR